MYAEGKEACSLLSLHGTASSCLMSRDHSGSSILKKNGQTREMGSRLFQQKANDWQAALLLGPIVTSAPAHDLTGRVGAPMSLRDLAILFVVV